MRPGEATGDGDRAAGRSRYPQALSSLLEDHALIRRFLGLLERLVETSPDELDDGTLERVWTFVDDFIDGFHHVREEEVLFRYVSDVADRRDPEIESLLHVHDEGRDHADGMRLALNERLSGWRTAFLWNAQAYARIVREHMKEEERQLFPGLAAFLEPEDLARLQSRFDLYCPNALDSYRRAVATLTALEARLGGAPPAAQDEGVH